MTESTAKRLDFPVQSSKNVLDLLLRKGAQEMLAKAIQEEVDSYVQAHKDVVDDDGRRLVVRNGYLPQRNIQSPLGDLPVQQPRVRDLRPEEERQVFSSKILPPYLRKTKSMEDLIPWLYLKGISTGDFSEALQALLGPQASGLSATTVTRLKSSWRAEYEAWEQRSLRGKRFVYVWADGVYFNVRLESPENRKQCILVLMGATEDGRKELISI